jgi:hypothetical protein
MNIIYLGLGIVLLVVTVALTRWAAPKGEQPSRIPDKWGLSTAVPLAILSLGAAGIILVVKAFV